MEVRFPDGDGFAVAPLLRQIPSFIEGIPAQAIEDRSALDKIVAKLCLTITGSKSWRFDVHPYGILNISRKAIELLWSFSFAYVDIYLRLFEGKQTSGDFWIDGIPELTLAREMLTWSWQESREEIVGDFPGHFPVPIPNAAVDSQEEKAFNIASNAILVHVFHELAHVHLGPAGATFDAQRALEQRCDYLAVRWMKTRRAQDALDQRRILAGTATGLSYLAAYGIATGRHDGIDHPKTYDRLVETLRREFDSDCDIVWAIPAVICAVHGTNAKIQLAEDAAPTGGFGTFYDFVEAFRKRIRESDSVGMAIARVDEIPPDGRKPVIIDETPALLLRVGNDFYAIEDVCTHDGQPLTDGPLKGCEITCPRHGARFDIRTGKPLSMPATEAVRTFDVQVRDGNVFARPRD